ncbi:putative colanic acid biosynthesis acetyltransferase [Phragmitibacter flavus]|uniref:Putative colanic acid biosynthesis acetyltransferase n=1 Tax=Phragmitibacter flavus TaxID=2576071 RepID=A0A5R8KCB5_9BACT|nr:putative colanic acid biosynthesis acetyltransferase [Phragmitibacter flavus]TLD69938.1 putative colanic acid biosynthesis acetyltransferase [Phragmitibacter flavus]
MNTSSSGIQSNRSSRKWTRNELLARALWSFVHPLYRFSPRLLWGWRRFMLRCFGAKVGDQVHIHPTAKVFIPWNLEIGDWSAIGFDVCVYNLGPLKIGQNVTISQRAHLCGGSHDFTDASMPLIKAPITVQNDVWICADAFIGPGVIIGERAVVGARSVVVKNVSDSIIVAGNPAKEIGHR